MPRPHHQKRRPRRKPADVLVRIRGLEFEHQGRGGEPSAVFRGVDLDFHRGKVVAILGPSGTGKTTLLKLIGGQLAPDRKSVV